MQLTVMEHFTLTMSYICTQYKQRKLHPQDLGSKKSQGLYHLK